MDTASLCLALAGKELENCIPLEMKAGWEQLQSKDCTETFTAGAAGVFFPWMCCANSKSMRSESLVFSKKNSDVQISFVYVAKSTVALMWPQAILNDCLKKLVLEQNIGGPLEKSGRVFDEKESVTSTNWGFRTITLLLHTIDLRNDCASLVQIELKRVMEFTLNLWFCEHINYSIFPSHRVCSFLNSPMSFFLQSFHTTLVTHPLW